MGGEIIGLAGVIMVFSIPISAIWMHHQREMAKIKSARGDGDKGDVKGSAEVVRELQAMRQEMALLRDTTTKFDMSFDAALSRLEQRMDKAEENIADIRPSVRPVIPQTETESAILRARNS